MKYWVFESGDVVGPYSPQELMEREDFGPHCLVCPEDKGEDASAWQEAAEYADFQFEKTAEPVSAPAEMQTPPETATDKQDVFDEELNTLLEEKSPLGTPEKTEEEPVENLHVPAQAPSKPGPIEDYFNNIKGEDLGNILGIPDPNENSDMNLARALQNQFSQTQPPHHEGDSAELEEDPFDAFTAKEDLEDKQSFPQDELDGVEPSSQQAPVILAAKPEEEPPHPKYRIRKKTEETAGNKPADSSLTSQPAQETAAAQPASAEAPGPVASSQEEKLPSAAVHTGELTPSQPAKSEEIASSQTEPPAQPEAQPTPAPVEVAQPSKQPVTPEPESVPLSVAPPEEEPIFKKTSQEPLPGQPAAALNAEAQTAQPQAAAPVEQESLPDKEQPASHLEEIQPLAQPQPGLPVLEPAGEQQPIKEEILPVDTPDTPAAQPPQPDPAAAKLQEEEPPAEAEPSAPQPAERPQPQSGETAGSLTQKAESANSAPDTVGEILQGSVQVAETPEIKEPIKEVSAVVDAKVNRVKPTLRKTAEIDQFLNEKIKEEKERRPAARKIVFGLGVLIVLLALWGLLWLFGHQPAKTPSAAEPSVPAVVNENAAVEELVPDAGPQVPSAQEVLSAPAAPKAPELSAQERALQVVKNYELPNSNGKIGDYFDRIYKTKLAQGYNAVWSAALLHNNVYIVKYRISKTRIEPVVYLFEVDVAQNKLIAALNNVTMDLVGKIN